MHPYKWDTLTIEILINQQMKQELSLGALTKMKWTLAPDLRSGNRTYLNPGKAVLANIVETNHWERPIYFSLGCHPRFLAGLDEYLMLDGFVNKLLPIKTKDTEFAINPDKIERILLIAANFKNLSDVEYHNMPRVSNILLNYYQVLYKLAQYYHQNNQNQKIRDIVSFIKTNMTINALPNKEKIITSIENFIQKQ